MGNYIIAGWRSPLHPMYLYSWQPYSITGRWKKAWRFRRPYAVGWLFCVRAFAFAFAALGGWADQNPVNACVENYSPMPDDATILVAGDLAKVTLGVQIDGHVVMGTQSIFVGASQQAVIAGKKQKKSGY